MMRCLTKWLIFPLFGLALAAFYLLYVGDNFKAEETKFELLKNQPNHVLAAEGTTETDWDGKQVLSVKERAIFYFSFSQNRSLILQLKYHLESNPEGERINFFINNAFLTEALLRPSSKGFNQISLTIPYNLLRSQANRLEMLRPQAGSLPLYVESLKIRNYKGYSTGLLTAYILPLPLNPSLPTRISWNVNKTVFFSFMIIYSLLGLIYGLVLSHHLQIPISSAFGKNFLILLPSLVLVIIIFLTPLAGLGTIILSRKSFLFLQAGLVLIVMTRQLNFFQPLMKFVKDCLRRIFNKKEPVILALIAGTFLSILFLFSLKFNQNITGFMVIGDYFEAPQIWTSQTLIHRGSVGYDGQFYYYIAHDPFILGQSYNHIDFPAYRYQRIIYPLTAWLLSFGQPNLIPYMMVAVNLLGILLGTYFFILILKHYGRSPWYSLFYASSWGFLLCLLRSLPEPLAITFMVMAVLAHLKGKMLWQVICLTLAALAQETTLLVSMAFLFTFLRQKEFRKSLYMLLPLLGYLFWQFYIFIHFQTFSFLGGTQNFGPPLWGIIEKFLSLGHGGLSFEKLSELLFLLLILLLVVSAFLEVYTYPSPLTLSFFGYALLTVFLNKLVWVEPWSYARATLGLLVFNLLIFTKEGSKLNLVPMLLVPIIFLLSLISMGLF